MYIIVIYKVITTKGNKWVSFQELYIIVIYKVITTDVILSQQSVIIVYNSNLLCNHNLLPISAEFNQIVYNNNLMCNHNIDVTFEGNGVTIYNSNL